MPTGLKDVAEAAGVSMATVSRVLAGKSVRSAYRAKVEQALRSIDYRPNLAARRLRAPEAGAIGIIVPDLTNSFFASFVRTVEDIAWSEGLRVMICDSNEDPAREAMHRQLLEEERVSGLLLAPVVSIAVPVASGTPVVLFDRVTGDEPHDSVMLDNAAAAAALVQALQGDGARSILGLFGEEAGIAADARERAFAAYAEIAGVDVRLAHIPFGSDGRREAVRSALSRNPRVDAILAMNNDVLLEVAVTLGNQKSAALACFDEAPWLRMLGPKLRVIAQPVEEMARAALTMLVERMADDRQAPRHVVFAGRVSKAA